MACDDVGEPLGVGPLLGEPVVVGLCDGVAEGDGDVDGEQTSLFAVTPTAGHVASGVHVTP